MTRDSAGLGGSGGDLLAVVTLRGSQRVTGDIPIFNAETKDEMDRMALVLSRTTRAMVHEMASDVYIIVKH